MTRLDTIRTVSEKIQLTRALESNDYMPPSLEDDMSDIDVAIFNGTHPQPQQEAA